MKDIKGMKVMRIKFKKDASVDFHSIRLHEWIDHTFQKGETIEGHVITNGRWSDITLSNGDLAESVRNDSFEILG